MISELFNILSKGWVGSILGIIGILLGIVGLISFRRSKSRPRPSIQKHSMRIVGKEDSEIADDLDIRFRGTKVDRLSRTLIMFWNAGYQTINGSDVVTDDPIRFQFSERATILSAKIAARTRNVNNVTIQKRSAEENVALLSFEFLDTNDGVTIEFLHTDAKPFPLIAGTIKGVPSGIVDRGPFLGGLGLPGYHPHFRHRKPLSIVLYVIIAIGIGALAFGLLPTAAYEYLGNLSGIEGDDPSTAEGDTSPRWSLIVVGLSYTIGAGIVLWAGRRRYPKVLSYTGDAASTSSDKNSSESAND